MDDKPPFSSPVKEYSQENYVFDEDGKQVLDSKVTRKYNDDHKLSEIYQYDPKTNFSETSRFIYDEEKRLKEVKVTIEDGEQKKHLLYEYKDGLLDRIIETAGDYRIVTSFDDFGNPTEKQTFTGSNLLISTTMYVNQYDENGRLVEKHTIFPSGDSERIDKYGYNARGLLIEEQTTRHQMISTVKHSYNDKGDLILSDFNPGETNNETLKREISYNKDNDITVIKEYRKGWCYQDRNNEFGLTGVTLFSYIR